MLTGLAGVLMGWVAVVSSEISGRAGGLDVPGAPVTLQEVIPAGGTVLRELHSIEAVFSEPVTGVAASHLLVNGIPASDVIQVTPEQFLFAVTQPEDGLITASWDSAHTIVDAETRARRFQGGSWTYVLDAASARTDVFISEFMADNERTLNDEDGDHPDWIEVHNAGETAVDLTGWFLTDSRTNLAKWRFPEASLPPKSYLVVFASEKVKTNTTGRFHVNFKLNDGGEYLALLTPATNVVSDFAPVYPKQFTDVSYGRPPGEPQSAGYFVKATPGAPNSSSGAGFSPEIKFTHSSGPFTDPFLLTLSTQPVLTNTVIRYTLNGTLPTNSSPAYVGPIHVTTNIQVRARAFSDGLLPGPPRTEAFFLLSNTVAGFTSDLPVLVIQTMSLTAIGSALATPARLTLFEPVGGQMSWTNPPSMSVRAGVKIRGSSTAGLAKSSFGVEFRDEFDQDKDASILGLPADSDWVLYAPNLFEPVMIHNPFLHSLSREVGQYSPRTRFVEVHVAKGVPVSTATYNGIYVLEEKIKVGKHRVDIDKLEPEHVTLPKITGGYLLKIDRLDPGDAGLTAGGAQMGWVDPKEREVKVPQRRPQLDYVRNYFNAFQKALASTNWLDPVKGYRPYIDADQWIDFHILEVLSGNVDALVLSTYLFKQREGRIRFGPHWDFDRALGSTDGRDSNPRVWSTGPFFSAVWWNRLFLDKDFWQKWVDRWQDLRRTHLALTNLHGLLDRLANEVRRAQPREAQRWRVSLRGGSYQGEVNLMKNWLSNRVAFIDSQLSQPPVLGAPAGMIQPGFILSIAGPTNTSASVYYTLDGSDPRSPQGAISPQAHLYTGPIRLDSNARVVARSRDLNKKQTGGPPTASSTPWSGPVAATYVVATPLLVLTEIMFHPAPPGPGTTDASSDYEFLEFKNAGQTPIALTGFRMVSGVRFVLAPPDDARDLLPGERVLVVRNHAAFSSRYPTVTNVVGEFAGRLGDAGNHLTLLGPLQEPILDFPYDDDWAPLADGFGFSLALSDETALPSQLGDASLWRLSARPGGSPGQPDPAPAILPRVLVNEVISNPAPGCTEVVELYNADTALADISGWWLTDDYRTPKKYRLPERTFVTPNGFHLLTPADYDADPTNGFRFSSLGDEAYLFSADAAGELTGWHHGFSFGPQAAGTSFARWIGADGRERFLPSNPSPGAANFEGPPRLIVQQDADGGLTFRIGGQASTYTLLKSDTLDPAVWREWRHEVIPSDGVVVSVRDAPTNRSGFYRALRR